jgi:hypothetical protein
MARRAYRSTPRATRDPNFGVTQTTLVCSTMDAAITAVNVRFRPKADNRLPGSIDPSESGPDQKPSFNDILQRMVH